MSGIAPPKALLWVDSFSDAIDPDIPRDALDVLLAAPAATSRSPTPGPAAI